MKLRLLITPKCNRNCEQCCNKGFDLDSLPRITQADQFAGYTEISLTGGEPLLEYDKVRDTIMYIREYGNQSCPINLYTAMSEHPNLVDLAKIVNLTITIHDKEAMVAMLDQWMRLESVPIKHIRVKLAPSVHRYHTLIEHYLYGCWVEKFDWIDDCPLPEGEEFKRI